MPVRLRFACLLLFALTAPMLVTAADPVPVPDAGETEIPPGYVARIDLNEPAEIRAILDIAERYFDDQGIEHPLPPVVMVLHGPEISMFTRRNYPRYREQIDLAAKLTALGVIDVRICETRMAEEGVESEDLLPFVGTVPFGPAEETRLREEEEYVYF